MDAHGDDHLENVQPHGHGSIEDARRFFGRDHMEQIVKSINRREEGGDGLADEFVKKYAEVQHV